MKGIMIMGLIVAVHIVGFMVIVTRPADPRSMHEQKLELSKAYGFGYVSAAAADCAWKDHAPLSAAKRTALQIQFAGKSDVIDGGKAWQDQARDKSPSGIGELCDDPVVRELAGYFYKTR